MRKKRVTFQATITVEIDGEFTDEKDLINIPDTFEKARGEAYRAISKSDFELISVFSEE